MFDILAWASVVLLVVWLLFYLEALVHGIPALKTYVAEALKEVTLPKNAVSYHGEWYVLVARREDLGFKYRYQRLRYRWGVWVKERCWLSTDTKLEKK
jgi:hypothetical protein